MLCPLQVIRALKPQLTGDICSTLLACLQQCLAAAECSNVARDVALELLLTLRELLHTLPGGKLLLYPQVQCFSGGSNCPCQVPLSVGLKLLPV